MMVHRHARLLAAIVLTVFATACASSGGMVYKPQPFPMPGGGTVAVPAPAEAGVPAGTVPPPAVPPGRPGNPPVSGLPAGANTDGYALSSTALSLRGAPYRNGGVDPANGFDCSGFVRYVYQQHGVPMPRAVREQFQVGKSVSRDHLEAGDLVFFSTVSPGASHVGIMIGGDQFIHAPSERGVVRVESLASQYWASRYVGAKRVS
jgi:cell wall-associated NlpC family hydrolase